MAYADDIASKVPAPDKLKGGGGDEDAPADDDEDALSATRISQMQEVMDAFKSGDAEGACDALEQYLDTVGYRR